MGLDKTLQHVKSKQVKTENRGPVGSQKPT